MNESPEVRDLRLKISAMQIELAEARRNADAVHGHILFLETEEGVNLSLKRLTDEQRVRLFSQFCTACGCVQPEGGQCKCWNDD